MASRRMIDPAFWQSESLMELDYRQRLLFIGLISNADDQGRLKGNPKLVKAIVFPFDDISADEVQADLTELETVECIAIYKVGSKTCIQILNWWSYQHPQWAYPSELPPMEGWQDQLRYRKGGEIVKDNWKPDSQSKPEPPTGNDLNGRADDCYTHLPKDLPNPLPKETPKAVAGPVVLELDIELEKNPTTTTTRTRADDYDDGSDLDFGPIDQGFASISNAYANDIGAISRSVSDKLKSELADIREVLASQPQGDETAEQWITYAIQEAALANVRKWYFIDGILENIKQSRSLAAHKITRKGKQYASNSRGITGLQDQPATKRQPKQVYDPATNQTYAVQ